MAEQTVTKTGGFTICSWNVNGLRTIEVDETLELLNSTILCLQETKITRSTLKKKHGLIDGYNSYFAFCTNRAGYSGVATFCKNEFTPVKSEEGLTQFYKERYVRKADDLVGSYSIIDDTDKELALLGDCEGRCIITQHTVLLPTGEEKLLTVLNVYCPRLKNDPTDWVNNRTFKATFHGLLEARARALLKAGSFVIMIGDFNISHNLIDRCEGVEVESLRQCYFRLWVDNLFNDGFVDTFRHLHPNQTNAFSCWCTKRNGRENNYGTRIDYVVVDKELAKYLEEADIHPDVFGSDHCPVSARFHSLIPLANKRPPFGCTKNFPEFLGKQTTLRDFVIRGQSTSQSTAPVPGSSMPRKQSGKRTKKTQKEQADISKYFHKVAKNEDELESEENNEDALTTLMCGCVGHCECSNDGNKNQEKEVEAPTPPVAKKYNAPTPPVGKVANSKQFWEQVMSTPTIPMCRGHDEPCILRTVRKKGYNQGRKFWACAKGIGRSDDPNGSCNYFLWLNN